MLGAALPRKSAKGDIAWHESRGCLSEVRSSEHDSEKVAFLFLNRVFINAVHRFK